MSPVVTHLIDEVQRRSPACGRTRVIAIDGPSGSGKTTFAHELVGASGATLLQLDDLYQGWHGLEAAPRLAADVLAAIAVDRIGRAPTWDWEAEALGADVVVVPCDLLVVEGVGAGANALAPFTNVLIWIDGPEEVRRERALGRDGDVYAPWWDVWAAQERAHFARERTRERAACTLTAAR